MQTSAGTLIQASCSLPCPNRHVMLQASTGNSVLNEEPDLSCLTQQQLIGNAIRWDGLVFCLLGTDHFIHDYEHGLIRYCSPALENALLSLGALLETKGSITRSGSYTASTSKQAFDGAIAILDRKTRLNTFADVQAYGVLSLHQAICGKSENAEVLAMEFASAATRLCAYTALAQPIIGDYRRIRASTYCGSITSLRMLRLINTCTFLPCEHDMRITFTDDKSPHPHTRLDHSFVDVLGVVIDDGLAIQKPELDQTQQLAARLFQLTEWVYKLRFRQARPTLDEATALYANCLVSYNMCFTTDTDINENAALVLFVHIYYHFCILLIMCCFSDTTKGQYASTVNTSIYPPVICIQAARNVVTLAQSYTELLSAGQSHGLVPHLVFTAAWFLERKADAKLPRQDEAVNNGMSRVYDWMDKISMESDI